MLRPPYRGTLQLMREASCKFEHPTGATFEGKQRMVNERIDGCGDANFTPQTVHCAIPCFQLRWLACDNIAVERGSTVCRLAVQKGKCSGYRVRGQKDVSR